MNESGPLAPRARTARLFVPLLATIVVLAIAVGCAFVLQFSTYVGDWDKRPATDVLVSPLDAAVIVVLIAAVWAIVGRLSWALALVTGFALLLAGINNSKIALRREPLFPADRSFVSDSASLVTMVDSTRVLMIAGAAGGAIVIIAAFGHLVYRWAPPVRLRHAHGGLNRRLLSTRLIVLGLSAGLLVHTTQFNQPGNLWRSLYDAQGTWQPWSQVHNYRAKGFVGGFLSNMPIAVMEQPAGYDAGAMTQISQRYAERAEEINAGRRGSLGDTNVVFVLSESFTDPSWLEGITVAENPIPVTQDVMAQTIAGRMYALSYGGGTSTMEFESLTGQSVGLFNPQVTSSPYQAFVADHRAYPSTVGVFSQLGHSTTAIHSYHLDMYKRRQAYQTLGFQTVIDRDAMQSQDRIETSRYISDAAAFQEVLYQLDIQDGPQFINLLTMQNHGAHQGSYPDPIGSDLVPAEKAEEYGQYARGLAHSDAALADFLTQLQARDEQTIVVFYGDHHPGIYPDELIERNQPDGIFATPFFVWNSTTNQAQEVPAIGPAMFLPLVYEAADAPVPPYVALLDEVRHTLPVIQPARVLDASGRPVALDALDEHERALFEDLRLVQFDFSTGQQFAVDAMWPGALVLEPN